jgi:hypothetical protein
MKKLTSLLLVLLLAALTLGAACTDTSGGDATGTPTATPAATEPGATTTEDDFSLQPGPTDAIPSNKGVEVKADKDPIYATITVEFRGGKGQYALTDLQVRVTLSNGEILNENLGLKVGDEIEVEGTRGTDRVEVTAFFNDGTSYKIFDDVLEFKKR